MYPVFFELADFYQQFEKRWEQLQEQCRQELEIARSGTSPAAIRNKIVERFTNARDQLEKSFEAKLVDINNRYTPIAYNPIAYSYFTLEPWMPDSSGIREYVHFHRHGESLAVTGAKDAQGDIDAWDKIARTERDVRILAFGKGAIKPFQEDPVHRQLLQLILCYERERLTTEEIVECFDKYCACGKESHDTDGLRKMRHRFESELRKSP